MPSAFYAKKRSSYITLEKYACAVLIRASLQQFLMYQRCFPLFYQRRVSSMITRSRLNRKHLYSTVTCRKNKKQNEIHRSRKVEKKIVKTALPCNSIVSLVQLQSMIICEKNQFVRYCLSLVHV